MKLKKILWITLGFIGLAIGAAGAVLPLLPAFPFLLLAAFSFGKSSERLHTWFINTKLYKNNLECYVKGQGMTWKTKIKILMIVTFLMAFGFFMMLRKGLFIPCAILGGIWLFHIIYFVFRVKTIKAVEE
ncbi:MAG: YbaN family protein [Lachnospiraceae bacterium]